MNHAFESAGLPKRKTRTLFLLNLAMVFAIVAVDWATPAGIVVGVLLCVPILLASASDDRREVWAVAVLAVAGKIVAAIYGTPPISSAVVWIPNRVFATLTVAASAAVSLMLQHRRLEALRAHEEAVSARDLNRLLLSLLAHDLRAPLAVAEQAWALVDSDGARNLDAALVRDVRQRLGRSRRAIDAVLQTARQELERPKHGDAPPSTPLREIREEVASFEQEARAAGKRLVLEERGADEACRMDPLVLRQVVAILVDNAVRYAVPGAVRVAAELREGELVVEIADQGPGLSAHRNRGDGDGSGMGLELCRLLVRRAGGELRLLRDAGDGTAFELRLPAPCAALPAPDPAGTGTQKKAAPA